MIEYEVINQKSWEIAAKSIMQKGRTFETYSKGQIRRIFELAKSNNFENDIQAFIVKYTPQPSLGQRPQDIAGELNRMKILNENLAKELMFLKGWRPQERMKFSQYLMWDLRIIEQALNDRDNPGLEKLKLILECEKVRDQKVIIDILTALSKTNYADRTPRKSEYREKYQNRRR
jgi:hypothetical protein